LIKKGTGHLWVLWVYGVHLVSLVWCKRKLAILQIHYSTYEPDEEVVQFSSKELSDKTLIDAETGEKVEPVSGIYNVKIKAERARLFHFGTD
jgi:hypothetical protein